MRRTLMWIFWLTATIILAITPFLVFVAGASDSSTPSDQARLGAIGIVLAWPLLTVAAYFGSSDGVSARVGRAIGRGTALEIYAAIGFGFAWHAADGPIFRGDATWAAYWLVIAAGWLALTRRLLSSRRPASSHPAS
jgi:Na+-driven multidrug efflux pump